jgi:lipid-A-disaccharide synthase
MKYYIIAGEASGDLHGSNLISELRNLDPRAEMRCWGGDLMETAGATLVRHYKDQAFMGFAEVLQNLPTIFSNLRFCKKDILAFGPDALILIDYPGFNLRIARWAKKQGLRVIYYISPQVWAWKESRVRAIRASVDKMLVILPFEKEFYRKWNYAVEYVGHPLVEVIDRFLNGKSVSAQETGSSGTLAGASGKPVIALLPGSRKQEILLSLPPMLELSRLFPDFQFTVAQAPGQEESFYAELLRNYPGVSSARNKTYELLSIARAACVVSGTATLETALFQVPEVVCYKGSRISYQIARRLIRVKYICLVNLIMDRPVVKELIQDNLTVDQLAAELRRLVSDPGRISAIRQDYRELKKILGEGGRASSQAAASIVQFLQDRPLNASLK